MYRKSMSEREAERLVIRQDSTVKGYLNPMAPFFCRLYHWEKYSEKNPPKNVPRSLYFKLSNITSYFDCVSLKNLFKRGTKV